MLANNQHPLTPTQQTVIHALAKGANVSDAAAQAGIHRTTVHTWCRTLPAFRAALREAQSNHVEALQDQLRNLTDSATALLKNILENENASDSVRLRAALAVIRAVEATHPDRDLPSTGDYERFMEIGLQAGHETTLHNSSQFNTSTEKSPETAPAAAGAAS